ncbi:MAG: hypothetical protein H7326_07270 [Bdellovibrionaceae bacterium]|nr:hypothetical protein [Pseudobdellovibrionaceae bacterium]
MKITPKLNLQQLAFIVSEQLHKRGIQATLVGGAVVTIYSDNEYQSRDLDFISPHEHKDITNAMSEIGFERHGKNFVHKDTNYTVEFPSGPIGIGNESPVKGEAELKTKLGTLQILSPTQCVMDRLAWFYHYSDRQCLDQALAVAKKHKIKFDKIKKWSEKEGAIDRYELFIKRLKELS